MVKNKTTKAAPPNKKRTLDQMHTEHITKFAQTQNLLPTKKAKLAKLKSELRTLSQTDPEKCDSNCMRRKSQLIDMIANLNSEISSIESCSDTLKYIVNTLPILVDYYDNENLVEDDMEEFVDVFNESNQKNILNYFMKETKKTPVIDSPKTITSISKAQLYNEYLNVTDKSHKRRQKKNSNVCSECGGNILISDGNLVCEKCGMYEPYYTQHSKPNYKEPLQDTNTYAYKRINHLTEILSQLQAKESTDIPPRVFECMYGEIKKRKIDKNDLDIFKLRRILKNLNLRKYYEHVPHILQIINGQEPPNFSRVDEAKIKKMFKDIQKPFALFCPTNRTNFLNYSYILHKFCELLDLDEYISYFPLLKNNTKLRQHDKIWKNICEHMRWKFYRSL
uniref:Viral late gene transcription factor 3 zinc ribbon domain-containing protein n=1 Tax=viral metagenome TaxID=1070528 RepID=A0A6C0CAT9_9ZZZZ